jgi:predicted amidophosphoribosyltransferase
MICPTCREEYPADAQFCPNDGNRLVRFQEGADPRQPAGGICPVCGQGFDPGVVSCPTHDEELVPPAVYLAMRDSEPPVDKKICPVCGAQYSGQSGFCGTDGAALVPVN